MIRVVFFGVAAFCLENLLDSIDLVAPLSYRAVVVRPEDDQLQCNNTENAIYSDPVMCLRRDRGYGQYEFRIHTHAEPFRFLSRLEDRKRTHEDWGDITRMSPDTELNGRAALWKQVDYLWRRVIEHASPDIFFLHALAGNCALVKDVFMGTAVRPRILVLPVDWLKASEDKPQPIADEEVRDALFWARDFQCSINDLYKSIPGEYRYVQSWNSGYAVFVRKDLVTGHQAAMPVQTEPLGRVCDDDDATRGLGNDHVAFIFSAFADPADCMRSCLADPHCTFWTYSTETLYCWNWGENQLPETIARPFPRWHGGVCHNQLSRFDSLPVVGFEAQVPPTEIAKFKRGFCIEHASLRCFCLPPFAGVNCQEKFKTKSSLIIHKEIVVNELQVRAVIATRTPSIAFTDDPDFFIQMAGEMAFAFAHGIWVYPTSEVFRFLDLLPAADAETFGWTTVRDVETKFAS